MEEETAAIYEIAHDTTELHMIFILQIENYKFSIHNIGIDYGNHIIHNSPCVITALLTHLRYQERLTLF